MAKTMIKGKFATGADVATVHRISPARQQWLDREIDKATAETIVFFTPLTSKADHGKKRKRSASGQSGKTVRLRAKKK